MPGAVIERQQWSKGAVLREPFARLVVRMFTFGARKIALCIGWNRTPASKLLNYPCPQSNALDFGP
ncbi:hypothetical protein CN181_23035 [Sinorhizobium medicae]|nr:hypothetical protein CN181_23035 [Sinorhizobium medicae]